MCKNVLLTSLILLMPFKVGATGVRKYLIQVIFRWLLSSGEILNWKFGLPVDIVRVDALARQKNPKRHFFRAIGNSFHEVTWIGLEPHQIFSFCNISTNMVARGVQSFGRNGPWWAGCLKYGQKFFLKFTQTCDEQMLKISRRYLDSCLI